MASCAAPQKPPYPPGHAKRAPAVAAVALPVEPSAVVAPQAQRFVLAWDWPWADANQQLASDFGARAILLWSTNVHLPLSQWRVIAVCEPHVRSTNVLVPFVGSGYFAIGAYAR